MTSIDSFTEKYRQGESGKISDFLKKSVKRQQANDLLGVEITAGVTLADLLSEGRLNDAPVSDEVREVLTALMGDKIGTQDEAINYFRSIVENGDASVEGLVNKLKGTLGELKFLEAFGNGIRLAENGSQEGFDLITDEGTFIQVKMYSNADNVISAIRNNSAKIDAGSILYQGEQVSQIDYAVSSNIYEELKNRGIDTQYGITLYEVPMTAEVAGNIIREEINEAAWENFFSNAFGVSIAAGALHGAVNAFMFTFKKKALENAIKDTVKSTGMTVVAYSAGYIAEGICLGLIPPLAPFIAFGTSVGTRVYLKGVAEKYGIEENICKNRERLEGLVAKWDNACNGAETVA